MGKTKRGKGTKIMAIAAGNSVPLAVTIDSPRRTNRNSLMKRSPAASSTNCLRS